jgi:uncharacterized protein YdeI (YjbR/CyaY-like superfamily)
VVRDLSVAAANCWWLTSWGPACEQRLGEMGVSLATLVSAAVASVGPMATLLPELLVTDPAALRAWLEEHHATSPGVRLVLTKKGGSDTTITWASAVEELLCFGWIDGQAGKRDEDSYTVRITPRRPKGSWSQRNVALVATLEEQGRMTDAGRAAVETARADGRWSAAYAGPATRQAPDDLAAAIAAEPEAQAMFDVLTSANRFALIHRVESMKRTESRARKITEMVEMLTRGETLYPQKACHPRTGKARAPTRAAGSP